MNQENQLRNKKYPRKCQELIRYVEEFMDHLLEIEKNKQQSDLMEQEPLTQKPELMEEEKTSIKQT